MSWETFEHEADVGLRVSGRDGPELFAEAGLALFDLVCDVGAVEERRSWTLAGEADGLESLLVDWLNDLVYLFEGEGAVCCRFDFPAWSETAYEAIAHGEPADPERHDPRDLVKAATYHGLSVRRTPDGLEATVILDV
ncbi:MAG TPA: archease [Gaiellaceae bacterium]|nr:archease [Gaiellaceae bacterium]